MATYYSQGDGAWSTLTNWDTNAGGGGSDPASVADMDDDIFIIQAGHDIEFDVDMSGFANGIAGLTITSHATDPGMLYCKYSADGTYHLKIKTGTNIVGTNAATFGRLLANSDGVWANSTALPFGRKFIIEFAGSTAGYLNCQYLDCKFYCTQPTNRYVSTYKTKYRVTGSASADTLTKTTHGLANGTAVMIMVAAGGSLPAPLVADRIYFVVNTATDTFKLALKSGGTAIDLTTDGSGDIDVYDGHTSTSTGEINVLTDVTGDSCWVTTDGHDAVVLVSAGPALYDQQRLAMTTINAGSIVLSANIDSVQYPGARIYLSSRNISLRSASTSSTAPIVQSSVGGIFQCEIKNTQGQVVGVTTFYGACLTLCWSCTVSGVLSSSSYGMLNCTNMTVTGSIICCQAGVGGGSAYAGNTYSSDSIIAGCSVGITDTACIFSGTIRGCSTGLQVLLSTATSEAIIEYCSSGVVSSNKTMFYGVIRGCIYALGATGTSAGIGLILLGEIEDSHTYMLRYNWYHSVALYNCMAPTVPVFQTRGTSAVLGRIACQNLNRVSGLNKVFDNYGDIIETLCDGTGDAPSVDPDGGNGKCIEASNIQAAVASYNLVRLTIINDHQIWLAAGTYTITYKVQTTYSSIAAGGLILTARYISDDSPLTISEEVEDATAISTRSDDTDWTQTIAVTFTQAADGWVNLKMELAAYEANDEVYVWPVPAIT